MIMTMMALWYARNSLTEHNNNSKIQINKALANRSPIYMHLLDSCWNRNVTDYIDKHDRFMRRPTNRYIWLDLHPWETVSQDLLADIWKTPIYRRYVAPLWYIILTPSQPVFVLTPNCYWRRNTTNALFFCIARQRLNTQYTALKVLQLSKMLFSDWRSL